MSDLWEIAGAWPLRIVLLGGGVLLAGRLLMFLTRQPARRSAVGVAAVGSALLAVPLSLLPGWLPISLPSVGAGEFSKVEIRTNSSPAEPEAPAKVGGAFAGALGSAGEMGRGDNGTRSLLEEPRSPALVAQTPFTPALSSRSKERVNDAPPGDLARASSTQTSARSATTIERASLISIGRLAFVTYALIAIALLTRLVIGHLGLSRIWRMAASPPKYVDQTFRGLAATVCPRAELRISHRASGPVCFGLIHPRVLVPASLLEPGNDALLKCIFAHELGHLARRDPLAGWLLGLTRAIYFVWPWLAGLRREVRLAQEHLADADGARHATGVADYAELLIRMTRPRPAPLGAAGARGPSSELYRRVTMLLRNKGQVEARCPRRWLLAIGGGLTVLAVAAAGLYVQPRSIAAGEPEKKDTPKTEPAAKPDGIKDLIEKLKKDVGDDPQKKKELEDLIKQLEKKAEEPAIKSPKPIPLPPPGLPNFEDDPLFKEFLKGQEDLLKQIEQLMGQARGGRGVGFRMGPDGVWRPLGVGGARGGGRLGVHVEKPSDVLASQLDLPNGQGLVCTDVPAESTAGKVGIKPHDILMEVAGKPVPNDVQRFVANLKDVKPDTAIDIVVLRKGRKETLKGVKLPEAKEVADAPFLDAPGFQPIPIPLPVPDLTIPKGARTVPQPPALPLPPGRGIGAFAGPGETVRVEQVNDAFTVFYSKNGVKVTISGTKEGDGPPKAESIEVDDNGKTTKAASIDKLPKEYQDVAKSAMKAIK